jgi:hypothetical protein
MHKTLNQNIKEMKSFGEFLIPYNFPQVTSEEEEVVNCLKSREAFIDGYNVILFYSKANWNTHFVEVLQVLGKYCPFLPISFVCKVGKKFLGEEYLSLVELYRDDRKIYCWTLLKDKDNKSIPCPYESKSIKDCICEGFQYRCLNPKEIDFY